MTHFFANTMPILVDTRNIRKDLASAKSSDAGRNLSRSYLESERVILSDSVKKSEELDKEIQNLLRFVPSSIAEAVIVTGLRANILFMNSAAEKLIGYSETETVGRTVAELFDIINRKTGKSIKIPVGKKHKQGAFVRFGENTVLVSKNGKEFSVTGSISQLTNDVNDIIGFVIIFYDMTAQRRLEERLKYISMHDALTGLYNRAYFEYEALHMNRKLHAPVSLIVCDIDGLKIINDTMGHKAGDDMLISVANLLKKSFSKRDIVARMGGDEFAVLLPGSPVHVVNEACQRIRDNISKYNDINSGLPLSISLGFAVSNNSSTNITSLFKEADNNMYKEKLHQSRSIRSTIVKTFMGMIGAKDFITQGHCERLKSLVELMAFSLGLSEDRINELRLLAEFHDIGKVGISDSILLKEGPLNLEERMEMQRHCEIGQHIAMASPDLAHIANWILRHHEWWNGNGYPQGIKGESIPIESRILGIIDAYDAMTNDRPYRKAMSQQEALSELKKSAGIQFDPVLVRQFIRTFEVLKIYVASSAEDAMLEIKQAYINDNPHKSLLFRFDSSGTLKQQIENGALVDIFISAAPGQMNELQEKKILIDDTREDLLQNKVVLIASKESNIICEFKELVKENIEKIAIGDPDTVPAGKYAQDVLASLEIWDTVKSKLVVAKDAHQVLKFVETEYIDVGIVYQSDALLSDKVIILDQAPDKSHAPVVYPVAVMKGSNNKEKSKEFIKFLTSDKAKKIFDKYGFIR